MIAIGDHAQSSGGKIVYQRTPPIPLSAFQEPPTWRCRVSGSVYWRRRKGTHYVVVREYIIERDPGDLEAAPWRPTAHPTESFGDPRHTFEHIWRPSARQTDQATGKMREIICFPGDLEATFAKPHGHEHLPWRTKYTQPPAARRPPWPSGDNGPWPNNYGTRFPRGVAGVFFAFLRLVPFPVPMVLGLMVLLRRRVPRPPFPLTFPTCPFLLRFPFHFTLCSDLGAPRLGFPQLIALVPLSINTPSIISIFFLIPFRLFS